MSSARSKWDATYGERFDYSMAEPPKHRACHHLSWMSELPDDCVRSLQQAERERCEAEYGPAAQKRNSPTPSKPQSVAPRHRAAPKLSSYENKPWLTAEQIAAARKQMKQGGRMSGLLKSGR
eukprot:TRINITY_DN11976_c0_g1_i1.p1 TRINITY_DN11976_c0_g1~~TRINITY_DN11976_c0_g1_i1.p1  ORF type:complete len:122 (-),score=10.63 TRINITY_DN11976_c0_g1_i1:93-458(-)